MRVYTNPLIVIQLFYSENIKVDDVVISSGVETYADWSNRQRAIETMSRKFVEIAEVTKYKF